MIDVLLQFSGSGIGAVLGVVFSLVNTVLGLVIAYIAFQGYRRNRSRPMLFVAIGFFLAFLAPVFLFAGFLLIPRIAQVAPSVLGTVNFVFSIAGSVSEMIGLLCILYGLRMPFRE